MATLTLNRPGLRNALDEALMRGLTETIVTYSRSPEVRIIILTGAGDAFCAGTDISWMEEMAADQPSVDARRLGNLLWQLRNAGKPTIAKINGPAIGAGLALATTCDISVADDTAQFSLPAVRLGTVPAVLAPFLLDSVSASQLRRYTLTGETFTANDARRIGFIHATCLGAQLDSTVEQFIEHLLAGAPMAQREVKLLLNSYSREPL
ncbi:MAG: enoyl-CoA hydratase-related protein, partial [Pseudomonadota bacterium]